MFGRLVLLTSLSIAFVASSDRVEETYKQDNVADKEYLLKQKFVYDVLFHVVQPQLKKDLYEIGQNYSIKENSDSYTNKEALEDYFRYEEDGLIPHDAIYSVYYYPKETLAVYKVLHYAKDFDTFSKTALYFRNRLNHDLFVYTFYLAVIHRPDTKYIRLPALYEILPNFFYNNELIQKAHHVQYYGKKEMNRSGYETYIVPYNYSGYFLNDKYDYNFEGQINYLTEDIGWNEYYFYYRNEYPFLFDSSKLGIDGNYRGEEYLYGHKQILARYNLERFANGLNKIEHIDLHGIFYPGYYPTLSYRNGLPFPVRQANTKFPQSKAHSIMYATQYESRVMDVVDSGYYLPSDGKKFNIYEAENGLNILGNLIEGNPDTFKQYYGSVDELFRDILGFNYHPVDPLSAQPSALQHFVTSMRDPAFYRIYFQIIHNYYKYKYNQGPYKREDLQFPQLKIQYVDVDKLVTYFDTFDSTISPGLIASNEKEAESVLVKARQSRLNHKPFTINVTVDAENPTIASFKIFIGPKFDNLGRELDFATYAYDYYYEIDNFVYDLEAGTNTIVRDNFDYTSDDEESYEDFYQRVVNALESNEKFKYQKHIYGFPQRLLLPKGKSSGLPMRLFVHVAPVDGSPLHYKSRIFGDSYVDSKAFGYPLDRQFRRSDFNTPNAYFKEVNIYHQE